MPCHNYVTLRVMTIRRAKFYKQSYVDLNVGFNNNVFVTFTTTTTDKSSKKTSALLLFSHSKCFAKGAVLGEFLAS